MTFGCEMIVLSYTKYGESAIVLHTLTRQMGRRSFMVRVGKGKSMAHFQPLNILEAEVTENPKSNLFSARKFTGRYPLAGIRNDIRKNAMTMFLSEVLYRIIKDGAQEEGLYEWTVGQILALDALQSDFANFHLRFLADLASALGFTPDFDGISPFAGDRMELVEALLQTSFSEAMLIPMTGEIRNEIAEIFLRYIEYHTETPVNIKSLKVLRELFA